MTIEYRAACLNEPLTVKSEILITSVRVFSGPGHDEVSVWNRGGKAGTLTVDHGDGERIAKLLLGNRAWTASESA